MEYKIRAKEKFRLILSGGFFYTLGVLGLRRLMDTSGSDTDTMAFMLVLYFSLYGAYVLAKPFLSSLFVHDRGLSIKEGIKPKREMLYHDIDTAAYDDMSNRVVFDLENGRRYVFEYIFEDINGFLGRLSQNGIDVKNTSSNPA